MLTDEADRSSGRHPGSGVVHATPASTHASSLETSDPEPSSRGRTLKAAQVVDEYTRECPAIVVDRSTDADKAVAALESTSGVSKARWSVICPRIHPPWGRTGANTRIA